MKVSLNWIKSISEQYQSSANLVPDGVEALVDKIGAQLGAVEEVIDVGKKYQHVTVVKVVESEKHPNADKLRLCLVDDGHKNKTIKRNQQGLIQIVCGAPNVRAGMLAAWIPPGATVPSSFDKEPFVIESRPIRNKTSHGMLASAKELGLGDDHSGILAIDKPAQPGDSFAELYKLDDYVIDIENKMFTHRPDCFGMLGIARELAGIQHMLFKSPAWYKEDADVKTDGRNNGLKLQIKNDVPKLVPRFCALVIKDVKVAPSPVWLSASLSRLGLKSINNIVDLTNFYMLLTAQPLHAYDYDKLKSGQLGARLSKKGEQLALLNGKQITLEAGAVVITDGQKAIGLGGIMGGADTEVDEATKNLVLESATFDMNLTRKTAMEYGLFTDAATRFTKNQSPRQNRAVIAKIAEDILRLGGGRVSGGIIDDKHFNLHERPIRTDTDFINSRLGLNLTNSDIKKLLENVEFKVRNSGNKLEITSPFWRTDIDIPEDIVEEVGRLYGYEQLPIVLPKKDLTPAERNGLADFKDRLRAILRRAGANEVLTYSFVHGNLLKKVDQDPTQAYRVINALSPDLQYYRLSMTPSLLDKVHPNIKAGLAEFGLFEIGKAHNKTMTEKNDSGLPMEFEMLSLVLASNTKSAKRNGSPFYQCRASLDYLAAELGIKLEYRQLKADEPYQVSKPFDYRRSAQVWVGKVPLGMVGEYKPSVAQNLKLPSYTVGFEIGISQLMQVIPEHTKYSPLNRFPELEQDFTLSSSVEFNYQKLESFMAKNLQKLSKPQGYNFSLIPIDIFQKPTDKTHKHTTWRIILWHQARTLTTEESNRLLDSLSEIAKQELKAERI